MDWDPPSPPSELFATEHAHVRMLSVMQTVFSRPLEREMIMTVSELATIFPNLDEIIDMHCESGLPQRPFSLRRQIHR